MIHRFLWLKFWKIYIQRSLTLAPFFWRLYYCVYIDINIIHLFSTPLHSQFTSSSSILFLVTYFYYVVAVSIYYSTWMCVIWLSSGDLFDMLLPMLSIYQEYVRNHHYSLQLLTECKQNPSFTALLARLENKPTCQGRSLETFLTYPMHQVL